MIIDGVEYIKKEDAIALESTDSICKTWIGKKVICRSRNEGVNCGVVAMIDSTGVELKDCRRLWYHEPKNTAVSWYEGVSEYGLSDNCRISSKHTKLIIEDYSLTLVEDAAFEQIMKYKTNEQS